MGKPLYAILTQDNTQPITVVGLQDKITGAWLNAATVTATLLDQDGNEVPGLIGIPLVYVPGSDGNYQGVVGAASFEPPVGGGYVLVVDADQPPGHGHWEIPAEVQARTS